MIISDEVHLKAQCERCKAVHLMTVPAWDYSRWRQGDLIQHALPMLNVDERELLITGTCGQCFDRLSEESPLDD